VGWDVEVTDDFAGWYSSLTADEQDEVIARVDLLVAAGPGLGRPVVDQVHQSRHSNMKELRAPGGIRVLFAFDPRRVAILLIGGDKSPDDSRSPNWNHWYDRYVPIADDLYDCHVDELRMEGLL
jgi:hypothetical protein